MAQRTAYEWLKTVEIFNEEISKGNEYFGEADILGEKYMTKYAPIFGDNNEVIGIYYVGKSVESILDI